MKSVEEAKIPCVGDPEMNEYHVKGSVSGSSSKFSDLFREFELSPSKVKIALGVDKLDCLPLLWSNIQINMVDYAFE